MTKNTEPRLVPEEQHALEVNLISTLSEEMHPAKISLIKLHEGATKFTLNEEDESGKGHMYPFNPDYTICLNIDGETIHAVIEIQSPEAYPLSGYSRGRGAAIINHSLHLSTPLALVHEVDGEWLVISDIREPIQLSEYLDNNAWLVGNPAAQVTDRVPRKGKTPTEDTSGGNPKSNTEATKITLAEALYTRDCKEDVAGIWEEWETLDTEVQEAYIRDAAELLTAIA